MKLHIVACLFIVCLATVPAQAQPGYWGWYGGYHASTAAESAANGLANVVSSAGMANVMNSEAAKNWEDARSAAIDNQMKYTNTYFQMRAYNRDARQQEAGPRPTSEQLFRWAQERAPDRLNSQQIDPLVGDISWPDALKSDAFNEQRTELQKLYSQRAAGTTDHTAIYNETQALMENLKAHIKDIPPDQYVIARKFIESLAYEARFPTG